MMGRGGHRLLSFCVVDLVLFVLLCLSSNHVVTPCVSLNTEGLALLRLKERLLRDPYDSLSNWINHDDVDDDDDVAAADPCSWSGVECSDYDGRVISLNLKDFSLEGTLGPELGFLSHIKSIILRNNSFSGAIPREVAHLRELEVLDLGYNNFTGPLPFDLGINLSLATLLLDNNEFIGSIPPELFELQMLSLYKVDQTRSLTASAKSNCNHRYAPWMNRQTGDFALRRLLNDAPAPKAQEKVTEKGKNGTKSSSSSPAGSNTASHPAHSPSSSQSKSPSSHRSRVPAPTPSHQHHNHQAHKHRKASSPSPLAAPTIASSPSASHNPAPVTSPSSTSGGKKKQHTVLVWSLVAIGSVLAIASVIGFFIFRNSKAVAVKPWATGISGKLQQAFVSGVPNLKRSELEAACEDFSNIIGSLSDGTVYKGTLSSGVEIAVVSTSVKSSQHWTPKLEAQFRKKIETLSKVNHKNFVNLIGHCEDEQPFTRMMVFEYAPNGSLFEHLHVQEAERLDWGMRLRIVMGMAYCLEHMHQLSPPIAHRDLHSSSVYLTEDYAAKISDFSFWSSEATPKRVVTRSPSMQLLDMELVDLETNVYHFGVILYEMITGEIPYSVVDGCLADWAMEHLKADKLPDEAIDPTLNASQADEVVVQGLFAIVKDCLHPDPRERPTMRNITAKLRNITQIEPRRAIPGICPLWWAELDILSINGSSEC